jgi:guanylate kinase
MNQVQVSLTEQAFMALALIKNNAEKSSNKELKYSFIGFAEENGLYDLADYLKNDRYFDEKAKEKTIYCILGASGTGKTTLGNMIEDKLDIPELISHTTREIGKGEVNGKTYYFVNDEEMKEVDKLEEAGYAGKHYALSKKEVLDKFKDNNKAFVIMERKGIKMLKKRVKTLPFKVKVKVIYVYSTLEEIKKRLYERNRNGTKAVEKRIKNIKEKNELNNFDIADTVVINKNKGLDEAFLDLKNYIITN